MLDLPSVTWTVPDGSIFVEDLTPPEFHEFQRMVRIQAKLHLARLARFMPDLVGKIEIVEEEKERRPTSFLSTPEGEFTITLTEEQYEKIESKVNDWIREYLG